MSVKIYEIRKRIGFTQTQFCEKFHLKIGTLQSWEQGWRNTPECILYMIQRILELESEK